MTQELRDAYKACKVRSKEDTRKCREPLEVIFDTCLGLC